MTWRKIKTAPIVFKDGLLHIPSTVFFDLAQECFHDISFYLRSSHLKALRRVFDDVEASDNERFIVLELLKNAVISSKGVLPLCQDTGTAIVIGQKGHAVLTNGEEKEMLEKGIALVYRDNALRYSQNTATSMFVENNTKTNLPACIDIEAVKGDEYHFLMMAKGGGSSNKTFLFQQTRALLNEKDLNAFLAEKIAQIGTSACPPYHLAVVIGGQTPEQCLKTVKLATAKALDDLPETGDGSGKPFRDKKTEESIYRLARQTGLGAQFGGKHFCLDVRCIRLPRHGASLPVGIGVSCVADRQINAKITKEGAFVECLETHPENYLPDVSDKVLSNTKISLNFDDALSENLKKLSALHVGDKILLNGTLIVARDIAHARFKSMIETGKPLPEYLKRYPVYYAGPAKTPEGRVCGSMGPTTAGRMDDYTEILQSKGASLIMLAKGARSKKVLSSCQKYGGFYLGTLGGAAAQTASEYIYSCQCIDFDDLGMEAVYQIKVKNFPAFVLMDDKGNDFYSRLLAKGKE